ncbi:polycystic kidney disease 2-like 1 protein, partial [Centruroides sculpturatus]|uniref:polycystic kidney disease 2-like 1 protein n=1 Tax=Centruroides sculpturatus TaxID=218467 RepID=UPI000C6D1553
KRYFAEIWNYFEIVILILSILGITFSIYRNITIHKNLSQLLSNPKEYPDLEDLAYWEAHFTNSVAITVFFSWIKFFKFISFNKTMRQLSHTISRCWKDVCSFGFMFFIVFFAYSQLGYMLFGYSLKDYCNIENSFFTLLRIILGEYDFYQLQDVDNLLGPLYFITYVFFVFFVLLNMFLAIINDTYANVKEEMKSENTESGIFSYLKLVIKSKFESIRKKLKSDDNKKLENQLDFDQTYVALKAHGLTDLEILYLFEKYIIGKRKYIEIEFLKKIIDETFQHKNIISTNIEDTPLHTVEYSDNI